MNNGSENAPEIHISISPDGKLALRFNTPNKVVLVGLLEMAKNEILNSKSQPDSGIVVARRGL